MIIEKGTEVAKFADHYGASYDTQVTIQWITPTWVNLKNLSGNFNRERVRSLHKHLKGQGVREVTFVRYKQGVAKTHTHTL